MMITKMDDFRLLPDASGQSDTIGSKEDAQGCPILKRLASWDVLRLKYRLVLCRALPQRSRHPCPLELSLSLSKL